MFSAMLFTVSIVALSQFALYYWRAVLAGVAAQPVSDRAPAATETLLRRFPPPLRIRQKSSPFAYCTIAADFGRVVFRPASFVESRLREAYCLLPVRISRTSFEPVSLPALRPLPAFWRCGGRGLRDCDSRRCRANDGGGARETCVASLQRPEDRARRPLSGPAAALVRLPW